MISSLQGEKIYLRPLNLKDANHYYKWVKDKEVILYSLGRWLIPYTKKQIQEWLQETIDDKSVLNLGIVEKETNKLIGHTGICSISKTNNSGEYFILIGDKNSWGKGYGTEVTKLVVDYGFKVLKLHRIMLTVSDVNIGAVKVYEKAGFIKEGIMRDASFRNNKYHNKIVMSILENEWKQLI